MPQNTIENIMTIEKNAIEEKQKLSLELKEKLKKANDEASQIIIKGEKDCEIYLKKSRDEMSSHANDEIEKCINQSNEKAKKVCSDAEKNKEKAIKIIISGISK